jgi:hypothetical protein
MQMPRKPTGITGAFRVDVHPDGTVTGEFEQIAFSAEKAAVELAIAEAFIRRDVLYQQSSPQPDGRL